MNVTGYMDLSRELNFLRSGKYRDIVREACLYAVQQALVTHRPALIQAYLSLPVKHTKEQAQHRGKQVYRNDGSPREHIWQAIVEKADYWRSLVGAFGAAGAAGRFDPQGPMPHTHLIEYGTTERHTASGAYRGRMPEFRVVRNIRDQVKPFVIQTLGTAFKTKYEALMSAAGYPTSAS